MPKKKNSRESRQSKGIVGHPRTSRDKTAPNYQLLRAIRQREAWLQGKNVVLTIDNPDKSATNARQIKVNARDYWGSPKSQGQS